MFLRMCIIGRTLNFFLIILFIGLCFGQDYDQTPAIGIKGTKCYDDFNRPQRCIPEFENAAFNLLMEATNTCGDEGQIEYCIQTGVSSQKSCELCYPNEHSARFLTDFHSQDSQTWWQSDTMLEGIQYPAQVNLTLHLGKAFDITYVRLVFYSPRPESFSIYKRTCEDCPWIPYQFYSASCRDTYGLPETTAAPKGEDTRALCTSEYSDISPLRGGNIAFSTLEGRPSRYTFDSNPELQDWVTATDIKVTLDRLNTFGDEVFGDPQVLRSYFYAVADIAVGARCKCNGHASECITSTGVDGSRRRVCKCEHNTAGPDCNECLPFYNDAPWGRGSDKNVHECKPCNCNGFSTRCYFDKDLYERTGHGGHCLDCAVNRDGPNCERCRENYYQREDHHCVACNCDSVGSRSLQCNSEGKCQCKPGVTGDKCDRCDVNHYDFGVHGCKVCGCSEEGSANNILNCDPYTGTCQCKENVEGKRCRECKPGFFNLDKDNEFGCTPCFCYGHSSQCVPAPGYSRYQFESIFTKSAERWRAEDEYRQKIEISYNPHGQNIKIVAPREEPAYFVAPDRFLGDQRASYNQLLEFTLRIGENRPVPTATDVVLEGAGTSISNTIFAQRNLIPAMTNQHYRFRLHEHPDYGWQPRLTARAFISILTNLTAIRIRGTYTGQGEGYLDNVKLETATRGGAGIPALWIEQCECPAGYVGAFCESCAPGYRHSPSHGGPFSPCVPCECNKHAEICEAETGRCICEHNTAGDNCEFCARGYYGNALGGTPYDCQSCGCPNGGACIQLDENIIMCVECPNGYTGHRCDFCSDGYFGDPLARFGIPTPCQPCECNLNIDNNAIGNCNTTTGECLKCIHNTGGRHCDQCLSGFYGDALALPKGDCKPCQCYPAGTEEDYHSLPICDQISGDCRCKPHIFGRNCDQCEDGYFNIIGGEGCLPCNCDPVGSLNRTCNLYNGQCFCRQGITGLRCDQCEAYRYGFSFEGCAACDCDRIGAKSLQCDFSGQCPCHENVEGRSCDRCKENKHDRQRGCVDCPECYNLVQDEARRHVYKLERLIDILDKIERNPTVIDDENFEDQLRNIQDEIEQLLIETKLGTGGDTETVTDKLNYIRKQQDKIDGVLGEIEENIMLAQSIGEQAQINLTYTEENIKLAEAELKSALESLETEGRDALNKAKQRAKEFGQQSVKMTTLAHEARQLSDDLDNNADNIIKTASEAKNKSIEAYELAKNASDLQRNVTQEIRLLKNDIEITMSKLVSVKQWTEDVHNQSKDAKTKALILLNEISNLVIPNVDIPSLKKQVDDSNSEARKLLNETVDLLDKSDTLLNEVGEQVLTAEDLLNRGTDQMDVTTDLLSDIDLAKAQAERAIILAKDILNEALGTYETVSQLFSDFDKQVKESQAAARQALGRIPEIQKLMLVAVNKTLVADRSLNDSKSNADQALSTASLYQNATKFKTEAGLMGGRLENTENEFEKLYQQTISNETLINEAKDKIGRAGKDSSEATKKVNEIIADIEAIMWNLQGLPKLDDAELNRLEEELVRAERKVQEANLDVLVERLQREHKEQNSLVEAYTVEVEFLRNEVANIREIANALPDGCFKRVQLEP
ncbi:hypothetical protein RI129_008769 [Pyrocoelia pectoralis]|uniref:Laminin subunit gamma-1 n=1 Tax=Pyrocoelia pectoralis TaxID=417401 RepID=A0AAN7ZGB0_9COLE